MIIENGIRKLLTPPGRISGFGVVREDGFSRDVPERDLARFRLSIEHKKVPDRETVKRILTGSTRFDSDTNETNTKVRSTKSLNPRIIDIDGYEETTIAPGLNIYCGEETQNEPNIVLEEPPPPPMFRPRIYIPPDEDRQSSHNTTQFNGQKLYDAGVVLATTHQSGLFKVKRFSGDEMFFLKPGSPIKVLDIKSGQVNPKNEVFETNGSGAALHYLVEGVFVVRVDHDNKKFYTQRIQLELPIHEVNSHFNPVNLNAPLGETG